MISTAILLSIVRGQSKAPAPQTPAQLAFHRFEQLAGDWVGTNGDGVKIRHNYSVIAAGSVVMEESWFDAHKDEEMVTMYHLDNGKLMLTHYCIAKNQPRLLAADFGKDGNRIEFKFLDATNIKDRNQGHMDHVLVEFVGKDRMRTRWSWYAKGKESWMENFTMTRVLSNDKPKRASVGGGRQPCCPLLASR